jgi:SAM-dependent methyltransferase
MKRKSIKITSSPWHERDIFWQTAEPVLFHIKRLADTPKEVDKLIWLLEMRSGDHILDLGCGIGRHSLELSRRGFKVTGVDRTQSFLQKARQQAKSENLNIEWIQSDMRHFKQSATFHAVISMFTSFGYFENPDENFQVVCNVYQSLKPGGRFLIDLVGKEILARHFRKRDWYELDGMIILEERKLNEDWSRIDNRWIVIADKKRTELHLSTCVYSAAELGSFLKKCGFTQIKFYGNLNGRPYDQLAERLIVVSQKPEFDEAAEGKNRRTKKQQS